MSDISDFLSAVRMVDSHVKDVEDTIEAYHVSGYSGEVREMDDLSTLEADIGAPKEETEDVSTPLVLINCSRQSNYYTIMANPEAKYFLIEYPYSLVKSLSAQIQDSADPESFLQSREIEIKSDDPEEIAEQAATELLADFGESNIAELEYQLMDRLLQEDVSAEIVWESVDDNGPEIPRGFNVATKLFPYEPTLSISEFDSRVQKITTLGRRGSKFIKYSFDLDKDVQQGEIKLVSEAGGRTDVIDSSSIPYSVTSSDDG
jgi:hypothetical protein